MTAIPHVKNCRVYIDQNGSGYGASTGPAHQGQQHQIIIYLDSANKELSAIESEKTDISI